ncbi:MAG TPA: hypothetical protein VN493_19560 [Thermoanaerobaculia bacterium]|nr:hypothetical protein [Thermoanaerobaculia bacterium]
MRRVELEVGRIVVEVEPGVPRPERLAGRVREALARLGERLQQAQSWPPEGLPEEEMDRARVALTRRRAEELLGPGGAERLADDLLEELKWK